jgi:hypothetical protein
MRLIENEFTIELQQVLNKYKIILSNSREGIKISDVENKFYVRIDEATSATDGYYRRLIFINEI